MKRAILEELLAARQEQRSVALATELDTGHQSVIWSSPAETHGDAALSAEALAAVRAAIADDRSGMVEEDGARLFVQVFNPRLRMIVVGAVHIAQALVPLAALTGYEVTVVDPRRAFATDVRFPNTHVATEWPDEAMEQLAPDRRTAVITLTHDPKLDDPALSVALRSGAFYIAALGSKRTHAARLKRLREQGLTDAELDRIHGPAGLALGAKSPAEIALSIMAQATSVLRQSDDA